MTLDGRPKIDRLWVHHDGAPWARGWNVFARFGPWRHSLSVHLWVLVPFVSKAIKITGILNIYPPLIDDRTTYSDSGDGEVMDHRKAFVSERSGTLAPG